MQQLVLKQLTEKKKIELTDATWGNMNMGNVITASRVILGRATSDIRAARSSARPFVSTSCSHVIQSFCPSAGICALKCRLAPSQGMDTTVVVV